MRIDYVKGRQDLRYPDENRNAGQRLYRNSHLMYVKQAE